MTTHAMIRLLALFATIVPAPAAGRDRADPLEGLRFLAGSCWRAQIPGADLFDVQCVEEMDGGFLRSRHAVLGTKPEYSGETVCFIEAETGAAHFIYFTSLGGVSRGSVVVEGDRLIFPDKRHVDRAGEELWLHGSLQRISADSFVAHNWRWMGGAWSGAVRMIFARLPASCRNLGEVRKGCAER